MHPCWGSTRRICTTSGVRESCSSSTSSGCSPEALRVCKMQMLSLTFSNFIVVFSKRQLRISKIQEENGCFFFFRDMTNSQRICTLTIQFSWMSLQADWDPGFHRKRHPVLFRKQHSQWPLSSGKYFSCYPQICSLMFIPLDSAIGVESYPNNRKDETLIPKTMTELYFSRGIVPLMPSLTAHNSFLKLLLNQDWYWMWRTVKHSVNCYHHASMSLKQLVLLQKLFVGGLHCNNTLEKLHVLVGITFLPRTSSY